MGAFTPKAKVASNDQALGKIVEAISHSSAWKEFAIFVIEDDAQNGPDHVDAHRTVGLVISPYCRRGVVDSTMYSTASAPVISPSFAGDTSCISPAVGRPLSFISWSTTATGNT